jgi:acyl-CoA synthetase (AMP-forming)/AMP-acid ligase II
MRVEQQADDIAYTFASDRSRNEEITYAELDKRARTVGCMLSGLEIRGKPVMLLYPPGIDYISAFFGCLYAGAIAVPAAPPDPLRPDSSLPRLAAIVRDAAPCVVLTTAALGVALSSLSRSSPGLSGLDVMTTGDVSAGRQKTWEPAPADAASIALLQYTSGSTSTPKGVVLTHRNLISNSEFMFRLFGHSRESLGVMWLPPHYGMGLIGGIIQPLYGGLPVTLMAPADFLRRPLRWLQEISRTRATISGGPSFAYDLCVGKTTVEERLQLDLSSWQVAFNTSAPVQAETMEQFARAFEPAGFRREAFHPCYGPAEATNIVTGGIPWSRRGTRAFDAAALRRGKAIPAAADGTSRRLVSCGYASVDHCRVVIVDPVTQMECVAGQVGEIWTSGSSVARSYWDRPEETREVFGARVARTGDGPFARSGDLGFVLDHELFVTGRLRVAGSAGWCDRRRDEIEPTAESSRPLLRPSCGAAFTMAESPGRLQDSPGLRSVPFLHELEPGTAQHRVAAALCCRDELDVSALGHALDVLIARRAATFPSPDGEDGQRIIGRTGAWLQENDARYVDDAQLTKWLKHSAHEPLDLASGQLARIQLYRRATDETIALVVAHHFIADFWSIGQLVRELGTLYGTQKGGIPAPLPELPDFVRHYSWVEGARASAYAILSADSVACPDCCHPGGDCDLLRESPRCLANASYGKGRCVDDRLPGDARRRHNGQA